MIAYLVRSLLLICLIALAGTPGQLRAQPAPSLDRLKLPAGFKVELWIDGIAKARSMAIGPRGTLFLGTTANSVYAIVDRGGRREAKTIAQGLRLPNGVALRDGALYVVALNQVLRFDDIENRLDNPPQPVNLSDAFGLPSEQWHGWKFIRFGPDGRLYIPVGAPCNVCKVDPSTHGHMRRYNPDGSGMEVVAHGIRNTVGFDFDPRTRELWFTDNGRDNAGEDEPQDELNHMTAVNADYGFPYCHAQGIPDRDFPKANACDGVTLPAALMGPHAAALGMRFYTGDMFPAEYKGRIFIARHGSWNRRQKFGYDIALATPSADGKSAKVEPFMTGFLDTRSNTNWGRPVDVQQLADGSLLVSDDMRGAIYRISYAR
jgi:glucose/arabinose dehydrogenase